MIKILFLAANPNDSDPLRLGEEVRAIGERLRLANLRDEFVFVREWAVKMTDLQAVLCATGRLFVHFSGHGSRVGEIVLEDRGRDTEAVSPAALERLFAPLKDNTRCVVLNACYTETQARGIVESIDCVIGMSRVTADESAIAFASGFYQALGYGRSIQEAYELGCGQIHLQSSPKVGTQSYLVPSDATSQVDQTPRLRVADGVNAATIYLAGSAVSTSPGKAVETRRDVLPRAFDDPLRQDTTEPIEVFFSYSHKDEKLREQLEKHLALLKRAGVITGWHDRRINAGREWAGEISEHLESAQIILLLVSPSYLASDYLHDVEMRRALERHERGEARVIPIIIRPADWQGESFGKFQVLPRTATPITSWRSSDEAFASVANGIREAIDDLKLVYIYSY